LLGHSVALHSGERVPYNRTNVIHSLVFNTILVLAIVGAGLYLAGAYNQTVAARRELERAFANVDVSLKQRNDEIPQLVEVCRGYAAHERQVLEKVVSLRAAFDRGSRLSEKVETENRLGPELGRLVALGEAYPDLKANGLFLKISDRLTALENEIADRRELFNAAVTAYNTWIQSVPVNVLARATGFVEKPLLELPSGRP